MKKIILALAILITLGLSSCNLGTAKYGGNMTIKLEPGEKLIDVQWKNNNLWYLVEPMEENYAPKTKVFKENSNAGAFEGTVTFIETR